jgi:hypothetical protein
MATFSRHTVVLTSKDHPCHVCFKLADLFQKRRLLNNFPIGSYVKLSTAVQPSWSEGGTHRHNFRRRTAQEAFQQSLQLWSRWAITGSWEPLVYNHWNICHCPFFITGPKGHLKPCQTVFKIVVASEPLDHLNVTLAGMVLIRLRWFLCEFPIGSYVKLSTAVQPSWSEGGTTRHNFRRRTTQESFQQSLVEISPVVSEDFFF